LRERFGDVFQEHLGLSYAEFVQVTNERIDAYADLIRKDPTSELVHTLISSAIYDTMNRGGRPRRGITIIVPTIPARDNFAVKKELIKWELDFIPKLNDAIDKAVASINKG
jgi:hypothetical protein